MNGSQLGNLLLRKIRCAFGHDWSAWRYCRHPMYGTFGSSCHRIRKCRKCGKEQFVVELPHDAVRLNYMRQPLEPGSPGVEELKIDFNDLAWRRPSGMGRCDVLTVCRRCDQFELATSHQYGDDRVCVVCGAEQPRREEYRPPPEWHKFFR
jgi:hypothetical protein